MSLYINVHTSMHRTFAHMCEISVRNIYYVSAYFHVNGCIYDTISLCECVYEFVSFYIFLYVIC